MLCSRYVATVLLLALVRSTKAVQHYPHVAVVILHGFSDSWLGPVEALMGMPAAPNTAVGLKLLIEAAMPGVYVKNLVMGKKGQTTDFIQSIFGSMDQTISSVCNLQLLNDPLLLSASKIHAIGISQGGVVLRGVLQSCGVRFSSFISLGGPHGGIAAYPGCLPLGAPGNSVACEALQTVLWDVVYTPALQSTLVPAAYARKAFFDDAQLVAAGSWLLRVNNLAASPAVSALAKERIAALDWMILYRFSNDTTVVPRGAACCTCPRAHSYSDFSVPDADSAWFSHLSDFTTIVPLSAQPLFDPVSDPLGLSALSEKHCSSLDTLPGVVVGANASCLQLLTIDGAHSMWDATFVANSIIPLLMQAGE